MYLIIICNSRTDHLHPHSDMDIMILANVIRIHVDAAFKTGKAFTQTVIESYFHTMPTLGNRYIAATMHKHPYEPPRASNNNPTSNFKNIPALNNNIPAHQMLILLPSFVSWSHEKRKDVYRNFDFQEHKSSLNWRQKNLLACSFWMIRFLHNHAAKHAPSRNYQLLDTLLFEHVSVYLKLLSKAYLVGPTALSFIRYPLCYMNTCHLI